MDTSTAFRVRLSRRILAIVGLGLPSVVVAVAGCSCPAPQPTGQVCIPPPSSSSLAGGDVECLSREEASPQLEQMSLDEPILVLGDAEVIDGQCCYPVAKDDPTSRCNVGRPFLVGGRPRTSALRPRAANGGGEWSQVVLPRASDLSPEERARLAAAWTHDGLFEHASVASFGRFALELLAAGAPADLVAAAHEAALDEIRHARLCFGLAGAYAGAPLAPSPFPFGGAVEVTDDLASIAARAAREGCIGETIAAVQGAARLAAAIDPAVRAALAVVAEDEARHAELAWRAVRWAIDEGGDPVRAAVAEVFAELAPGGERPAGGTPGDERLAAHGWPGEAVLSAVTACAIAEVIRPAAAALVARPHRPLGSPASFSRARSG